MLLAQNCIIKFFSGIETKKIFKNKKIFTINLKINK